MNWHQDHPRSSRRALHWLHWRILPRTGGTLALLATVLGPTGGSKTAGTHAQQPVVASQSAPTPLVFDGVTVIDVQQGTRLPAQRVVIVGNRIQAIGRASTVRVPQGARVVDARGKYLIPGLWDLHTHSWHSTDWYYPLFIANGVTGIRDAGSMVPLETLQLWRQEILAGTRVGPPRQLLSGPAIDEEQGCRRDLEQSSGHLCVEASDTADARHVVDSLKAAGADMIKTYHLGREMYFVIAAEARRMGIPFGGHVFKATGITPMEASDSGASILDHMNAAARLNTLCVGERASVQTCRQVAERFQRNGTWWVPTLVAMEVMKSDMENAVLNRGHRTVSGDTLCMRWDEFIRMFWADSALHLDLRRGPVGTAGAFHISSPTDTSPGGILTIAHRVGLPMLVGTDVSQSLRLPPGFALHTELALYVAEGLTPVEALRAATLNPAKLLHATDSLGTVAQGKLADLVLLDADPLADITNTTAIRAVVANGRYYDRAALDQLLTLAHAMAR